jgi:hypothetical protein
MYVCVCIYIYIYTYIYTYAHVLILFICTVPFFMELLSPCTLILSLECWFEIGMLWTDSELSSIELRLRLLSMADPSSGGTTPRYTPNMCIAFLCVCTHVCMYVCVCVCVCACMDDTEVYTQHVHHFPVCMYTFIYVCMYACMNILPIIRPTCASLSCMHVHMCVRTHVLYILPIMHPTCVSPSCVLYIHMHVCTYISVYIYVYGG